MVVWRGGVGGVEWVAAGWNGKVGWGGEIIKLMFSFICLGTKIEGC